MRVWHNLFKISIVKTSMNQGGIWTMHLLPLFWGLPTRFHGRHQNERLLDPPMLSLSRYLIHMYGLSSWYLCMGEHCHLMSREYGPVEWQQRALPNSSMPVEKRVSLCEMGRGLNVKPISLVPPASIWGPQSESFILPPDFLVSNLCATFLFFCLDSEPSCCKLKLSKQNVRSLGIKDFKCHPYTHTLWESSLSLLIDPVPLSGHLSGPLLPSSSYLLKTPGLLFSSPLTTHF